MYHIPAKRLALVACATAFSSGWFDARAATVDFETQIKPILAENCLKCHGDTKRRGGLRLSNKRDAFLPGDSGEAVLLPGKADDSLLIQRVVTSDEDDRMPSDGVPLSPAQIDLLKQWVNQGAKWPDEPEATRHWAYVKPVRATPPRSNKPTGRSTRSITLFSPNLRRADGNRLRPRIAPV